MQVVCYFGKAAHQGKVTLPTDSLLAECEDFAQRNGLTGLFAISDGYFLHLLEGDDAAVQGLVSRIAAFWTEESPTILFERHKFRGFTNGAYNTTHSDLSGPQGGYGTFSVQYAKLRRAAILNEEAALKSTSWGAFQIMGFNHVDAGYATVGAFVDAMIGSQSNQLKAFVSFVGANNSMKKAIIAKDWATFARLYNGPDYAKNNYDTKMKNEYDRLVRAAKATNS